jgi:acyl-CoA synthetase (AMP-forming)/AMP-acid ligase II
MGCTHVSINKNHFSENAFKAITQCDLKTTVCNFKQQALPGKQLYLNIKDVPHIKNSRPLKPQGQAEDYALFTLGSGTTGNCRIIPCSFTELDILLQQEIQVASLTEDDRYLALSHFSFNNSKKRMLATLSAGGTAVFKTSHDSPLPAFCNSLRITHLSMVIVHANRLIADIRDTSITQPRLPFLKMLSIGSSVVTETLRENIKKYLTPNLFIRYGTNEYSPITTASPKTQNSIGSIGTPCPGVTVEIVTDDGRRCNPRETGLIRVQGPGMFQGYLHNIAETKMALRDGWFYPGDLGCIDKDGTLLFKGRNDDLIIYQGTNIYPFEIEHCLKKHPDVDEVAAFPVASPEGEDIPTAAVTLKNSARPKIHKELTEFYRKESQSRLPLHIVVVDEMPRNAANKILKRELKRTLMGADNSMSVS